jgi:hypothetical protein
MVPDNRKQFRRRLAETVAWCAPRADLSDPANCLRTPALRPANWFETAKTSFGFEYRWGKPEEDEEVLRVLATRRADLLRKTNTYPDSLSDGLAGGRLLIADPRDSDVCGLSPVATGGFIDDWDVPPWDTWVDCMQGNYGSILLCWIPASFIPLTEQGIAVNPVECFFWASDYLSHGYPAMLFRELEEEGLLKRIYP